MKAIFAIFALCLVAVNAGTVNQDAVNYEGMVNDIVREMGQIAKDAAGALQYQVEEIVFDPLSQIETFVESIEARREESEECVAKEDENVTVIVDDMHTEMAVCGVVAAKSSAGIMYDISKVTHQLLVDGYDVSRTYKRCKRYKNSILKSSCYAHLTIKATLYLNNARKSIKAIKKSTNERIPAVMADSNECTHIAADSAIHELENVNTSIDYCIGKL